MKKVLYITNISVPYRTRFFEELGKKCDLTVLFESERSSIRNDDWIKFNNKNYKSEYLNSIASPQKHRFSFQILKHLSKSYDCIIIGCYNSPVEILAILYLRLLGRKFAINIDGEVFKPKKIIKYWGLKFVLKGADAYLSASTHAIPYIKKLTGSDNVIPYYFSSVSKEEVNNAFPTDKERNNTILVVSQYHPAKGLDVLLEAAKKRPQYLFKIVGSGKRYSQFLSFVKSREVTNVEVVDFLKKEELQYEYETSRMLVLPSIQECWGLVINEGATYGIPIVSTTGSGSALDFLQGEYSKFLAKSNDVSDLISKIDMLANCGEEEISQYSAYLKNKAKEYTTEHMVEAHLKMINNL